MSGLPSRPLPSFVARNPHVYGATSPEVAQAVKRHNEAMGKRKVLRVQQGPEEKLNKAERRFLAYLRDTYRSDGRIGIADITLRLAADLRYTPDFTLYTNGETPLHLFDVKAIWKSTGKVRVEDDAMVKLKTAAALFPMWVFQIVYEQDGIWQFETIPH